MLAGLVNVVMPVLVLVASLIQVTMVSLSNLVIRNSSRTMLSARKIQGEMEVNLHTADRVAIECLLLIRSARRSKVAHGPDHWTLQATYPVAALCIQKMALVQARRVIPEDFQPYLI